MKQLCLFFIGVGLYACADSQTAITSSSQKEVQTIDSEYLRSQLAYFIIENNSIKGEGKTIIENMVNQSQFVTYGEVHNSKQTSVITKALMPLLHKASFKHFAIEVGPNSAEKLMQLSTPAEKTMASLKAFNTKYSVSQNGDTAIPIPFFDGVGDAQFLQEARKNGMILWGLDQEYYYGAFFLMDELLTTVKDQSNYKSIEQLKNIAMQAMYKHFVAEVQKKIDDAYPLIIKENAVKNFFNAFDKDNKKAQKIITDLKLSWDIYIRWRNDSHADRISYIRNNFTKHYNEALSSEKLPKVFTKIGSLHASKLISNGAFDVGNLTEELAKKNGTISTCINSWAIFSKENDSIINNTTRYRGYGRYKLITDFAKHDQWAIINYRAIRKDIEEGKIALPTNGDYHDLKRLIYGYDYQLLIPADENSTPNRN